MFSPSARDNGESRTGEHIDLRTCVVDVIFARDVVAGEGEKIGERVSKHSTAAVTNMYPVGLAETHSTLTFSPFPMSLWP